MEEADNGPYVKSQAALVLGLTAGAGCERRCVGADSQPVRGGSSLKTDYGRIKWTRLEIGSSPGTSHTRLIRE